MDTICNLLELSNHMTWNGHNLNLLELSNHMTSLLRMPYRNQVQAVVIFKQLYKARQRDKTSVKTRWGKKNKPGQGKSQDKRGKTKKDKAWQDNKTRQGGSREKARQFKAKIQDKAGQGKRQEKVE